MQVDASFWLSFGLGPMSGFVRVLVWRFMVPTNRIVNAHFNRSHIRVVKGLRSGSYVQLS